MTPVECVELCRYVRAAVPHQQWDANTPDVWFDLGLADVKLADARDAVKALVRQRVFVDFHGILTGARRIERERLVGVDHGDPPDADPDDVSTYLAALREHRHRVAAGEIARPMPRQLVGRRIPAREVTP